MTFRAGGIMSGLDTNSIVEQLVALERIPIQTLQRRQQTLSLQRSLIGNIETALGNLLSAMEDLDTDGKFLAFSATSSDEDVLAVQTTGEAAEGTHNIQIQQLAHGEQDRTQAFTDPTDAVRAGTLTVTVQGEDAVDVTIEDGDTLADVAYKINTSGARVSATIIDTGTESYLTLYALDSGHEAGTPASDAVILQESYTGGSGQELTFTETVQAQNAQITFDGLAIERRSNTISDVVSGLTLNLIDDVGQPSAKVTVKPDTEAFRENVDTFISAYNSVVSLLNTQLKYTEGQEPGVMFGDSTLRSLMLALQTVISDDVDDVNGDFTTLGLVGIDSTADGTLSLNATEFGDAMAADFRGISALFTTETSGVFTQLEEVVDDFTDPIDGLFKLKKDGIDDRDDNLQDQIDRLEIRVAAYEERLVAQFTYMETVLSQLQGQQSYLTSIYSGQ